MPLPSLARRTIGVLATGAVAIGVLGVAAPTASASPVAPEPQVGYLAQAYGTYANSEIGDLNSGPTAYSGLACSTEGGRQGTNNSAEVDLGRLGDAGVTRTTVGSIDEDGVQASYAKSETAGVNLGRLVQADAITSESNAVYEDGEYRAEQTASLANLRVLGTPIEAEPGPNTKIDLELPGVGSIGTVELNKQEVTETDGEYQVATTALRVTILQDNNPLGLDAGTELNIGQSRAHLLDPELGYLTGSGFASQVTALGGIVESGRTSMAGLSCLGGGSNNSVASTDLQALGNGGAAQTQADGEVTDDGVNGTVTNEIADVELLNGLIQADAIRSVANVDMTDDGEVALSADGSELAGLRINGEEVVTADLAPNTEIDVLDIATITLNKQVETDTKIAVTQLEVVLDANVGSYDAGTRIQIGHAEAGITPSIGEAAPDR